MFVVGGFWDLCGLFHLHSGKLRVDGSRNPGWSPVEGKVVYPVIFQRFYTYIPGGAGFLNHQQYEDVFPVNVFG